MWCNFFSQHLIEDNIKLKNNIFTNVLTGTIIEFAKNSNDFIFINDEVASLVEAESSENNSQ